MFEMQPRYAIYFAPQPTSPLWQLGSAWLGRDAITGEVPPRPEIAGISPQDADVITIPPRRYGFHATLKAPFRLSAGCTVADLVETAKTFASRLKPFSIRLGVGEINDFLALRPVEARPALQDLADDCVRAFEPFRATPAEGELARRLRTSLQPEERRNIAEWGYPYVFGQYRFHMTLTGRLKPELRETLKPSLARLFDPLLREPVPVASICLFCQAHHNLSFELVGHYPFAPCRPPDWM